jgi:3-mercaptopyruvate sulfurtransferase SseA
VALALKRVGVTRVRPLAGGFGAWRERGFEVEPLEGTSLSGALSPQSDPLSPRKG